MEDQSARQKRFRKNWDFKRIRLHVTKSSELHQLVHDRTNFNYFSFALTHALPASAPPLYIFSNFPEALNRLYDENSFWEIDPIVNFTNNRDYVIWNKTFEKRRQTTSLPMVFDEIKHGVTFWFALHGGVVAAISFAREKEITKELAESMNADAYFICCAVIDIAISEKQIKCDADGNALSGQELRILRLTADGMTAEQIANEIFITKSTVNFHIKNVNKKLQSRNKTQAIAKAALMSIL